MHAIERARERFGLELTERDLMQMVSAIESGGAVFERNGAAGAQIWLVPWDGVRLRVVFAPAMRAIFTIMGER